MGLSRRIGSSVLENFRESPGELPQGRNFPASFQFRLLLLHDNVLVQELIRVRPHDFKFGPVMIHSSDSQGHYLVTANLGAVYVRVVGLGSMNNCFSLQDFLQDLKTKGYAQFIFDLKECRGFDSTFMGVLIGLAGQARSLSSDAESSDSSEETTEAETAEAADASRESSASVADERRVIIVNCGDEQRKLLQSVGVDRVVRVCDQFVSFPEIKLTRLKGQQVGVEQQLKRIVKAHQDLIELDSANEEKFGAFLNLVKTELHRTTSS